MNAQSHAERDAGSQIACISLAPDLEVHPASTYGDDDEWLAACYRVTARVERIARQRALLDLGICARDEALAVMRGLLAHLAATGWHARGGIAPTPLLAQLVVLAAPDTVTLGHVAPEEVPAFLRRLPVDLLASLYPQGIVTPEVVERLRQYGLQTLGHIARLDEMALCRQFGKAGAFLYAVTHGVSGDHLHPKPQPEWRNFRLHCAAGLPASRVQPALVPWIERIAALLRQEGNQARELRLTLLWASGSRTRARRVLRQHTNDPAILASEVWRLLQPQLAANAEELADLRLTLSDFAPDTPAQDAFWQVHARRLAQVAALSEALARRHGHPVIHTLRHAAPAAIFPEDRHVLAPTGTDEPSPAPPVTSMPVVTHSAWQDVSQRIHWW